MKKIKSIIVSLGIIAGFGLSLTPSTVGAYDVWQACDGNSDAAVCNDDTKVFDMVTKVVNVLLFLLGIVCVGMIVMAGARYASSGGDAALITKAKNTILYAVIGLVVAILAYAIVNFVVGMFF